MTEAEQKSSGSGVKWLIGCSVALVATGILCVGGGLIFGAYFGTRAVEMAKEAVADVAYEGVMGWFEESGLPEEEVAEIGVHLDRLRSAVPAGNVDIDKLGQVFEEIAEGPLLPMGIAYGFASYGLANPALSADERAEAMQDVRRFQKGLWEGTISARDGLRVFENSRGGGSRNNEVNWEDVRQVRWTAGEIRHLADGAGITDTEFDFDISDEIGKRVSEVLGD